MGKAIAVIGDVTATPGTTPYPPANTGAWTAGPVIPTVYPELTIDGTNVIYEAQCIFTFSGAQVSGPTSVPVSGVETVTLKAGSTKVQGHKNSVLVDGDSETGNYGNKLQVSTGNPAAAG